MTELFYLKQILCNFLIRTRVEYYLIREKKEMKNATNEVEKRKTWEQAWTIYGTYNLTYACIIHVGTWVWVLAMPRWWGLTRPKLLSMAANAQAQTLFGRFKG